VKIFAPRTAIAAGGFIILGALLLPGQAFAHLGGDTDSVSADRELLHAQLRSTPMQHYNRHEISTPGGTLVHEYTTLQGTVFALTWQGPVPPNLRQLFGTYYNEYQDAAASQGRPGAHRQLDVRHADLVVQSTGRLRSFSGRAYVPSLVPAGVTVADIQ
jgi:hypothetical protein